MTEPNPTPAVLRQAGRASWAALGVIALMAVLAAAVGAASGILVPLIVAVLLGLALEPVTESLKRLGLPTVPAVALTLIGVLAVLAGVIAVVVRGLLAQWPEIYRQLIAGWRSLVSWIAGLDIDTHRLDRARAAVEEHVAQLGQGALGVVGSTFYGALSLVMGTFFAVFFLFFVLRDAHRFPAWLSRITSLDADQVAAVVDISRQSVRGYFRGTAITALLTAPIFMVPLLLLRIPLAFPIFVLYFLLSFVPFVGAWITGAFAVLIAFGAGGPTAALILGITFIISNGTVQSAVSSWALGSSLRLHPVAVLLATMIGGTVAGLLGMVIGAPLLAVVVKSVEAVRGLRAAVA